MEEATDMRSFAIFACALMVFGCLAGLGAALDPLDKSDKDADPDRDNLKNWQEFLYGTDPNDPDSDQGGCYDGWEVWYETHRAVTINTDRVIISQDYHFDPNYMDDDGYVAPWKNQVELIQVRDGDANVAVNDPDNDGWNNLHEFYIGSDPTNPNTDGDGYNLDSADPDPLVDNDPPVVPPGPGNGGPGSGEGVGGAAGMGMGNGGGGSGVAE